MIYCRPFRIFIVPQCPEALTLAIFSASKGRGRASERNLLA
jgi:hypothetical protein